MKYYYIMQIHCIILLNNIEFGKQQILTKFQNMKNSILIKVIIYNIWKKLDLIFFFLKIILYKIWKYYNI